MIRIKLTYRLASKQSGATPVRRSNLLKGIDHEIAKPLG
jgi:hypothetical protein